MANAKRPRATKSTTKSGSTSKSAETRLPRVTTTTVNIQEAIRTRAYELFEKRGCEHGYDVEDWLRAEVEVMKRFGASAA